MATKSKARQSTKKSPKKSIGYGVIPQIRHTFEREALFLALCGLCAFYFIALYSYHPLDPSPISVSFPEVRAENLTGRVGAYISGMMMYWLGLSSYVLPLPIIITSYLVLRSKPRAFAFSRILSWLTLMFCSSAVLSLYLSTFNVMSVELSAGGVFGDFLIEQLSQLFGPVGSQLFIVISCLCSFILVIRREIIHPTAKIIAKASEPIQAAGGQVDVPQVLENSKGFFRRGFTMLSEQLKQGRDAARIQPTNQEVGGIIEEPQALSVFEKPTSNEIKNEVGEIKSIELGSPDFFEHSSSLKTDELSLGEKPKSTYTPPSSSIFRSNPDFKLDQAAKQEFKDTADLLVRSFADFQITGEVIAIQPGPVVTVYEFQPATGTKINKVTGLLDDIALSLKVDSIFINPVAGKRALGVQVPNKKREMVYLGDVISDESFKSSESPLTFGMGKSLSGRPISADLTGMPHLLAAGATGAGKSVAINALLCSVIMKASPDEVKMILVDPKMLELSVYEGIPHLLTPVITEPQKASLALRWATLEMEKRYKMMQTARVRHITGFNKFWDTASEEKKDEVRDSVGDSEVSVMPYILLVIDELADLMLTAPKDVENSIQRLAQKARACGIHLVLATQRPSVDVITGIIKANLPCRIAFQTVSKHDSRTILDQIGADKLLGKGDMLFQKPGTSRAQRVQGAFITDEEVLELVEEVKKSSPPDYDEKLIGWLEEEAAKDESATSMEGLGSVDDEPKWDEAISIAQSQGAVSASYLQRQMKIGYNRAARIVEAMHSQGLVGPPDGSKPRKWLGSSGEYSE